MRLEVKGHWHKYADTHVAGWMVTNEVLCSWPRSLMSSASIQKVLAPYFVASKWGEISGASYSWQCHACRRTRATYVQLALGYMHPILLPAPVALWVQISDLIHSLWLLYSAAGPVCSSLPSDLESCCCFTSKTSMSFAHLPYSRILINFVPYFC